LYGSTISNSLIRVDTSVGLLTVEEIFNELLNLGDSSRATDKYDLINFTLFHAGVIQNLLNRLKSLLEKLGTEFFKFSTSDGLLKVNSISDTFNCDLYLMN
jgi:hypothetical protein